jgi:uncharacterized membrane protein
MRITCGRILFWIHDGRLLCSLLPDSNRARILVSGFLAVNYGMVLILRLWRSCLRLFFNVLKRYLLNLYYIEPSISSCAQMTYTVL